MDKRGRKRGKSKARDTSEDKEQSRSRRSRSRKDSRSKSRNRSESGSRSRSGSRDEHDVPVEDVRKHILQHYGISAEEEKARKDKKAEKFRSYVQNSGLQLAFQLVISELISKDIPKDQAFKYASGRFREIGKEYTEIKKSVEDGEKKD